MIMKRLVSISLCFALAILALNLSQVSLAAETSSIDVIIKGRALSMDVDPILRENRAYIPVRYFAEALDFKVEWIESQRRAKLTNSETTLLIPIGVKEVFLNDKKIILDEKSFIEKGRIFLPLRAVAEILSQNVNWDQKNKIAIVGEFTSKENIDGKNYDRISEYMKEKSIAAFSPYYELLDFQISNYEEKVLDDSVEATFFYKIIEKNYDKDPDTVGFIKEAKESGDKLYQTYYDEYLQPRESNFDFKIIIDKNDVITLYSNISPKGLEWEKTKMTDYILNK